MNTASTMEQTAVERLSWLAARRLGAIAAIRLCLGACKVDLYTNLDERQANEMIAALAQSGIAAERVATKTGLTLTVDQSRFAAAVEILKSKGLPRETFANLGEVFKREGLVSSPAQERARMIFALGQELSQSVSMIDGVLSARVHLVLPENDLLKQTLVPSSASVFIRHRADVTIAPLVPQIKMLVANGVAGLTYDKVSVVLVPATESMPDTATGRPAAGGPGDPWTMAAAALGGLAVFGLGLGAGVLVRRPRTRIYPLQPPPVKSS